MPGPPLSPEGSLPAIRSLRLRADQSRDSGVGDWGRKQTTNERMRVVLVAYKRESKSLICVFELRGFISFFIKAPMLILREASEIFTPRCFAYFPLAKYAFLF